MGALPGDYIPGCVIFFIPILKSIIIVLALLSQRFKKECTQLCPHELRSELSQHWFLFIHGLQVVCAVHCGIAVTILSLTQFIRKRMSGYI